MAKFVKPISIEAPTADVANKVQDAIKNMLSLFSASEIIKMSEAAKSPMTRTLIKKYL